MDRYDLIMAQAKEIAERQRQEEVEDNNLQSDSELSELASNVIDGMDIDSVESGDIEMGGIAGSGSLADQDSQEEISGRVTIQVAGTSPRRTRSGKVVRYRDD